MKKHESKKARAKRVRRNAKLKRREIRALVEAVSDRRDTYARLAESLVRAEYANLERAHEPAENES